MESGQPIRASFRDPGGVLEFAGDEALIRRLTPEGLALSRRIETSPAIKTLQDGGQWITARRSTTDVNLIEHPRVFFPSHAFEWAPSMLHRAAQLTLDINHRLLGENLELKDASHSNVLFQGPRPIFVDHLSPAPRDPHEMGWRAYGQYCRCFLIPLAIHRARAIPLNWIFLANREGLSPEQAIQLLGPLERLKPGLFGLVTLPARLSRRGVASESAPRSHDFAVAQQVNARLLRHHGRKLEGLRPRPAQTSNWLDYQDSGTSYVPETQSIKDRFIAECLEAHKPATVLDLGCNTGKYSLLAARSGARVVALDSDSSCIDRLFIEAETAGLDIQPLVVDLGRPSPGLGWDNVDGQPLMARVQGRFEMVFALALIHHLLVRERIPIGDILGILHGATRKHLILEWVPTQDPQFRRLVGPSQRLYQGMDLQWLRGQLGTRFRILRETTVGPVEGAEPQRTLLLLERA